MKQLRKRYDIPIKRAPKLILKGDGDLKGSSIGYKEIEFSFVDNKEQSIYFASKSKHGISSKAQTLIKDEQ